MLPQPLPSRVVDCESGDDSAVMEVEGGDAPAARPPAASAEVSTTTAASPSPRPPPASKKRRSSASADASEFVIVPFPQWGERRESAVYEHYSLFVHKSIAVEGRAPTTSSYQKPGMGFYLCRAEGGAGVCGERVAASRRNEGVNGHLVTAHPELHAKLTKLPNPAAAKQSTHTKVVSVLQSALPFSPFSDPHNPIRALVPDFPSPKTFRAYCARIVESGVASIKEAINDIPTGITFDFTPLPNRELAGVNVHFWPKDGEYETVMLGIQELQGSLTSDAIKDWLGDVLALYGTRALSAHRREAGARVLWIATDAGANVAKAAKEMCEPATRLLPSRVSSLVDFKGNALCVVHAMSLVVRSAVLASPLGPIVAKLMAMVKAVRHSRPLKEAIMTQQIKVPGRVVATRWHSTLPLIKYWVQNARALELAHDELKLSSIEVDTLAVAYGVLEPLDALIVRLQHHDAGDAFFVPLHLLELRHKLVAVQGLRRLVPDSTQTTELQAGDLDAALSAWKCAILTQITERFFSFETDDFEDVDDDDDDDDAAGPTAEEEDDDDEEEETGDSSDVGASRLRIKRQNILMFSATRAAYAVSPLQSVWAYGVVDGALPSNDNTKHLVEEDATDGLKHAVVIRHLTDPEFRATFERGAAVASAQPSARAGTVLAQLQQRRAALETTDPVKVMTDALEAFRNAPEMVSLFTAYIELRPEQRTRDVDRKLLSDWVELGDKHAPWVGALLRVIFCAPMRSTKCEGDFSIVQHLQSSRRLRMSRVVLAAYMLAKRASKYVVEPSPGVTAERTKDITIFTAPKGARKPLALSAASAPVPASHATTSASAAAATAAAAAEASDDEEPDLRVTTRSVRSAKVVRAMTAARRMVPAPRAPARAPHAPPQTRARAEAQ